MKRPARERCAADGSRLAMDRRRARQSPPEKLHTVNASRRRRVYFSETTVMRGGTSSALISGYSTFLRLRSEGRCCWRGRSEVFGIWHARVERDARHEMMRRREEKRRSAVGGSDGKNAFPPTHRARRPSMRGPYRTPAFRKSPRAASSWARPPPFSGFRVLGVYPEETHLLGPGFGVALGGLGVDVRRRANDEAHGGTDHDSHVS